MSINANVKDAYEDVRKGTIDWVIIFREGASLVARE